MVENLLLLLLVWINIILLCEGPFPQPDYYCLNIVNTYSPKHKHDIDKIINIFHSLTDMAQGSAIQEIQSSPNLYYFHFSPNISLLNSQTSSVKLQASGH